MISPERRPAEIENDIGRSFGGEAYDDRSVSRVARLQREAKIVADGAEQRRAPRRELARHAGSEQRIGGRCGNDSEGEDGGTAGGQTAE